MYHRSSYTFRIILSLLLLGSFGIVTVVAAPPPPGGYFPGDTLDPECSPIITQPLYSPDCGVNLDTDFLALTDTPGTYTANQFVRVNATGDGLEFVPAPSGGSVTMGDPVVGGDPNSILFLDNAGDLAQSANFTYQDNILFESLMTGAVNNSDIAFRQFSDDGGASIGSPTAPAEGFSLGIENPDIFSGFVMVHADVSDFAALPPGSEFGNFSTFFVGNASGAEELESGLLVSGFPQALGGASNSSLFVENFTSGLISEVIVEQTQLGGQLSLRMDDGVNSQSLALTGLNDLSYTVDGTTIWRMPTTQGSAGQALVLDADNETLIWDTVGGGGGGVTTLNTLSGAVTLSAGSNISFNTVGNDIEINATAPTSPILFANNSYYTDNTSAPGVGAQGALFFGGQAGDGATNALTSNFFGFEAGLNATNADRSNFFGFNAGSGATNAANSNFLGLGAGFGAIDASDSNFFGANSGALALNASNSNFIGRFAGNVAANASQSNFIGDNAGSSAVNASQSNFIGLNAGTGATNASNSSFLGENTGGNAINAANSIFIGRSAGNNDTVNNVTTPNDWSILLGNYTNTGGFSNSILLGGSNSPLTPIANTAANQFMLADSITNVRWRGVEYFLPSAQGAAGTVLTNDGSGNLTWTAGGGGASDFLALTDTPGTYTANQFVRVNATGDGLEFVAEPVTTLNTLSGAVTLSAGSNISFNTVGNDIEINASSGSSLFSTALGSNFQTIWSSGLTGTTDGNPGIGGSVIIGPNTAGGTATTIDQSVLIGLNAGLNSSNILNGVILGSGAGEDATNSNGFIALGISAGDNADEANGAIFLGGNAGRDSTSSENSFFAGSNAGRFTTDADNAIFIGFNAGNSDLVDNSGDPSDYSILLGQNTSTGGFSNSIAIGGGATNTASNQFMIGSAGRPINTLILTGAAGNTCTLDVTVASPSCTSDETLKTNISDLESVLDQVIQIRTINYDWINFPDAGNQIGFIAQDLEQYFPELVSLAPNGKKTVSYGGMTPILVQAIRELDMKIEEIAQYEAPDLWATLTEEGEVLISRVVRFASRVFAREICLEDEYGITCITRGELNSLLTNSALGGSEQIDTPFNELPPVEDTPSSPDADDADNTEAPISEEESISDEVSEQDDAELPPEEVADDASPQNPEPEPVPENVPEETATQENQEDISEPAEEEAVSVEETTS